MLYSTILEAIGNTPLVELRNVSPNPRVRIFAKLEGQNPGGSLKDRIAHYMIKAAEESGELRHTALSWRPPAATQASAWP